jgi:hypothetical protein
MRSITIETRYSTDASFCRAPQHPRTLGGVIHGTLGAAITATRLFPRFLQPVIKSRHSVESKGGRRSFTRILLLLVAHFA